MATAGPNAPGTMADDGAVGTTTWTNPGNVASSNNVYAVANPADGGLAKTSHYLNCTNFGFAVPSGATINGVTVVIERSCGGTLDASHFTKDATVSLVKGGTVSGNNKADTATSWTGTDTAITYGGAADLWGLALTDSDVNASTFGMVINVTHRDRFAQSVVSNIDFISITIDYTAGAGGLSIPVAMQSYRQRRV